MRERGVIRRLFLFLGTLLFIAGCAVSPQDLGVSDQEWLGYGEAQRQQILADYKQITLAQKADKPAKSAILTDAIKVSFDGGEAMMPPFTDWLSYQPATLILAKNSCGETWLNQRDGEAKVSLRACYKHNALFLDPSRYDLTKSDGTINFPVSPLWKQGFEYVGISSSGYVRLRNANVYVIDEAKNVTH